MKWWEEVTEEIGIGVYYLKEISMRRIVFVLVAVVALAGVVAL